MNADLVDQYIDAWQLHPFAGGPNGGETMERLLALMTDKVRYEDVPSQMVFEGHDGIVKMCAAAYKMSADMTLEIVSRQSDGRAYAFEWVGKGTLGPIPGTGRSVEIRGVSVGEVSEGGLVQNQRDYWDMSRFLAQSA